MSESNPVIDALRHFICVSEQQVIMPGLLQRVAQEGRNALAGREKRSQDAIRVARAEKFYVCQWPQVYPAGSRL
jgi:hypothetical protein